MDNYICINGKKAELTEEQLEKLGIKLKTFSSFDRQDNGDKYYFINSIGEIVVNEEYNRDYNYNHYNVANYCTDKELLKKRVLYETLNRRLWRYSMENGGEEINWEDYAQEKFRIFIHFGREVIECEITQNNIDKSLNEVYFASEGIARRAIREVIAPFCEDPRISEVVFKRKG